MGFFDTVKGWFNIGGVKVKIEGLNQVVPKDGSVLSAKVVLTSKSVKQVSKLVYKFLLKRTTGSGEEKKTKEFTISQFVVDEAFTVQPGEPRTFDFQLVYSLEKSLKDMGGVLGGIGKFASFASGEKEEYFVIAEAVVKGAAFNPSHWLEVTVK